MPLITTLEEIKEVLPKLVSQLSDTSLLPNFDRAEYKYIVPVIGPTQYDTLLTNYNASTLDADETILVKKLRLVIAAYAFKDEIGLANVTIGDTGARKLTQGGTDRVFAWEYNELKNTLINAANDGLDIVLSYLFTNKALYPEWIASDQYKKIAGLMINTGEKFDGYYTLYQPSRTYFLLRNVLFDTQKLFIEETIGKDLLQYLFFDSTPTAGELVCHELLLKSLAFFTVLQGCKHFSVSFTDHGYTIIGEKSASDTQGEQLTDIRLLEMKMHECERQGNDFLNKAKYELVKLYSAAGVVAGYVTAFDLGPLKDYVQPVDMVTNNEKRKIFVFP